MPNQFEMLPAMTPYEVLLSAARGNAIAASIAPLHPDYVFRFPAAIKHVAQRQGSRTAAEVALECVKAPEGVYIDVDLRNASAYVAACVKARD